MEQEWRRFIQVLEDNFGGGGVKFLYTSVILFTVFLFWRVFGHFIWKLEKKIFYKGVKPYAGKKASDNGLKE